MKFAGIILIAIGLFSCSAWVVIMGVLMLVVGIDAD